MKKRPVIIIITIIIIIIIIIIIVLHELCFPSPSSWPFGGACLGTGAGRRRLLKAKT